MNSQQNTGSCFPIIQVWVAASILAAGSACGAIVAADWVTVVDGTVNGVSFSITGLSNPAVQTNQSYTGAGYSLAPQLDVKDVVYDAPSDWTISFSTPVTDLYLYAKQWRGAYTTGADPTTNYSFSMPFTVFAGLTGASISGNSLVCPDGAFYSGILKFAGPISTLSVTSDGPREFPQVMTFGTTAVPEPSALGFALLGVSTCVLRSHKRASQRIMNGGSSKRCLASRV